MQSATEYENDRKSEKQAKRKKNLSQEEKLLFKIEKLIGEEEMDKIRAMDFRELKTRVNSCEVNIKHEKDEFHRIHGEEEERLKDLLKELRQPLKDAICYQEAIKQYALIRQELLTDA